MVVMFPRFLYEKEQWAATKKMFILARAVNHVYCGQCFGTCIRIWIGISFWFVLRGIYCSVLVSAGACWSKPKARLYRASSRLFAAFFFSLLHNSWTFPSFCISVNGQSLQVLSQRNQGDFRLILFYLESDLMWMYTLQQSASSKAGIMKSSDCLVDFWTFFAPCSIFKTVRER